MFVLIAFGTNSLPTLLTCISKCLLFKKPASPLFQWRPACTLLWSWHVAHNGASRNLCCVSPCTNILNGKTPIMVPVLYSSLRNDDLKRQTFYSKQEAWLLRHEVGQAECLR